MKETINVYDDSHWVDAPEYPSGTKKKVLRDEEDAKTILLKLPKGFFMAPHSHLTTEQHFLIDGEYISEGRTFHAGTYQLFDAHETHGPFESKTGALILMVWDPYPSNKQ